MRKRSEKYIIVFVFLLFLCTMLSACTFVFEHPSPKEGIWYCEELMIEIDFSCLIEHDVNCAKKYNEDGTYQEILCFRHYGPGITICSQDQQEYYIANGTCSYKKGVLYVTTHDTKHTYVFVRIDA